MKEPLISICIPTWNRWYSLKHTLESIVGQDEFLSGDVEIVISDNASTDETEIRINELYRKYNNIRYYRNKKNIGPMPNIKKVMGLGTGEYVLACGSDDYIHEGGLKKLKKIIDENECDIVVMGNNFKNGKKILDFTNIKDFLNFLGLQYKDGESYWDIQSRITWISSGCIRRLIYKKNMDEIVQDKGSKFLDYFSFQHSLIWYNNDYYKKIISYNEEIISPLHISYENTEKAHYSGRSPNYKIVSDFNYVFKFLIKKYGLNPSFIKLYRKCKLKRIFGFFIGKLVYSLYPVIRKVFPENLIKLLYKKLGDKVDD